MAFDYRITVYDGPGGSVTKAIETGVTSLNWRYERIGGCGPMELVVGQAFDAASWVDHDYHIEVDGRCPTWFNRYRRMWSGYVVGISRGLHAQESLRVRCLGYRGQLSRLQLHNYYDSQKEVSVTVKDIVENWVAAQSDILYDAALIESTSFTYDDVTYNNSVEEAIVNLAELGAYMEWGVDRNRYFFFLTPESAAKHHRMVGKDVSGFDLDKNYERIRNRVYLTGKWGVSELRESSTQRAVDQQQTSHNTDADWGETSTTMLFQTFTPSKKSLSGVTLRTGTKTGFTEYLTDGDMELAGVANWPMIGGVYTGSRTKENIHNKTSGGSYSLRVECKQRGDGVFQDCSPNPASAAHRLRFKWVVEKGGLRAVVWNITDGVGLEDIDDRPNRSRTLGGQGAGYISFRAPGNKVIRIIFEATEPGTIFYVDDVSVKRQADAVLVSLWTVDGSNNPDTKLSTKELSVEMLVEDLPDNTDIYFPLLYYPLDDSGSTKYGILIERTGNQDASHHYALRYNTLTDDYTGGELRGYWMGAWAAGSYDLYFKTHYNVSIETYGLREESVPETKVQWADDVQAWIDGYLSTKQTPEERHSLDLGAQTWILEQNTPQIDHPVSSPSNQALGLLRVLNTALTDLIHEIAEINYTVEDEGLRVSVSLGDQIPDIGRRFKQLEHRMRTTVNLT
jgi:hypothetical protein